MRIVGVIPARLNSKRFPNKVLYRYHGKPLLFYIFHEMQKSKMIDKLIIATDSSEIEKTAIEFGADVQRTSKKHQTGTDRLVEIEKKHTGNIFVNIQADNFGIKAKSLDIVIKKFLKDKSEEFGTLVKRIASNKELLDLNNVKVTIDRSDHAITFSRLPIPAIRDSKKVDYKQFSYYYHIGIYLFRRNGLLQFAKWSQSPIEKAESLEQMRILENGSRIKIYKTKLKSISIDSKSDLRKIEYLHT